MYQIYIDEDDQYSNRLLQKLLYLNSRTNTKIDSAKINKAIYYAKKYHCDQKRQSGEPYYSHPLEVAYLVSDYLFDTDILVISILHDVLEDTNFDPVTMELLFGEKVVDQVKDLTRKRHDHKISSAEMVKLLWRQKKYETLLIKQFDRLHNMQTISSKPIEKQKKIVDETLRYFLSLSEAMEMPKLADLLYKECCRTNVRLGVIKTSNFTFNRQFKFSDILNSQNNTN